MEERAESTRFFRRENYYFFSCWSCSRRLRGEVGRAEDPFGRKKLAEAGPLSLPVNRKQNLFNLIDRKFLKQPASSKQFHTENYVIV
jgi:hypothetical protein